MKQQEKRLPLSSVTLVFGVLSIPLAFAGHLCSLAAVLGAYGTAFGLWGRWMAARHMLRYTEQSVKRARLGLRLALFGTGCALVMWALWASSVLLA
jgi:hypothetical protein